MAYEDFLETLSPDEHEAIVNGEAFVGEPEEAIRLIAPALGVEPASEGLKIWKATLAECETQEDAAQIIAHLFALRQALDALGQHANERVLKLHAEVCSNCRERMEAKKKAEKKLRRGLEAAKAAFAEAIDQEDEPWRASLDDEDDDE